MGFLDEVKKKMNEASTQKEANEPAIKKTTLENSWGKSKEIVSELLLQNETISNYFGFVLGFAVTTNKRLLIGVKEFESTEIENSISYIPLNKINSISYQQNKKLVTKLYDVLVNVSSKSFVVQFTKKEDAIKFHKVLSEKLLEI